MKINRALRHAVPTAANRSYEPGDQVLVWREKIVDNRIGEWLGPFAVASFQPEKKLVLIQYENRGPPEPFNVVQMKPYITLEAISQSFMSDLNASVSYYCEPENNSNSDTSTQIHLTEIIDVKYPRSTSTEMTATKKKEIRNLLERGTFKVILKEDIPTDANVLPGGVVLAIKSAEDGEIKFKARYVIGGHRDKEKNMMVHTATTLQRQSIQLLLALANIHDFDIWTSDVRQAYLQSSDPLDR